MKYTEALQKRKLEVENLSKGVQKKIEELHYLNDAYNNLDSEGIDEESQKNLEEIQEKISSLDESIADFIYAFDSEKYQKQLESMAKTRAKRKNAGGEVQESAPVLVPVASVPTAQVVVPTTTVPVENVVAAQVAPVVDVKEPVQERAVESVYDKLEDLKKSVHIDTANFKTRQRVEEEEEQEEDIEVQEEEFDKHSDTTPKKMSTGLILMGVGAFFLTWGAVNFFKSRR
jgi:hypothetical protein